MEYYISVLLIVLCILWAAPAEGAVIYPRERARETAPAAAALARALGTEARAGEAGEGGLWLILDPSAEGIVLAPDRISAPTPAALDSAAALFIQEYIRGGRVTLDGKITMSVTEARLRLRSQGSPYKKQYSDYNPDYTEETLLSFDDPEIPGEEFHLCQVIADREYMREGRGAVRLRVGGEKDTLRNLMWRSGDAFHLKVEDKQKTTLKLWVFIDDADNFATDHDAIYGRQKKQATLFFRILDSEGHYHAWNHTFMGSGWHEIELSFAQHNGYYGDLNYGDLTGFGMLADAAPGTVIELDSLRAVKYRSLVNPPVLPLPARLISECEYDSYDGCSVQEWYGAYFAMGDSLFGRSSYAISTQSENGDFRQYIGCNTGMRLDYYRDELVLWMKVNDLCALDSLFIELNEDQDRFEYEKSFKLEELQKYGLTAPNKWCRVAIPLTDMWAGCPEDRMSEKYSMPLNAVRFYAGARDHRLLVMKLDRVYVTDKNAPD
ncbi:MAG: hypothetical protein IJT95_01775, partial [Abditibacteriota bacterium]|nr:hypothetical protein [Abditibacteriota bacterium]